MQGDDIVDLPGGDAVVENVALDSGMVSVADGTLAEVPKEEKKVLSSGSSSAPVAMGHGRGCKRGKGIGCSRDPTSCQSSDISVDKL